jgi:acetate---CoA ligase (ADP-forming)
MPKDLTTFLYPNSIAVIGASRSPEKVGAIMLKNIADSGYKGKVFPVNPNADSLNGFTCYKDIYTIPETPDVAIITLPSEHVIENLYLLGDKGTKNVIVISAGFKETGDEGAKLEQQLIEVAKKYAMNVLGPNCLGYVNNLCPLNATFGEPVKKSGNLKFITQSGAIATSLFDWCHSTGLGFSSFITLGNKAVLNENDFLNYFLEQSQNTLFPHREEGLSDISPIGLYLESITNGREFINITSEITKKDPVFLIKPGKTAAAAHAMQSHTGAIAGEDAVLECALEQAGVLRCETLEDFFDLSRAFAWNKLPAGPNVGVISNAGGPAVISADSVITQGLKLAELDQLTKDKLLKVLPRSASIYNPVDVLGDALADRYAQAAEILLQNDQVNSLVVILTPQIMTQIGKTAELVGSLAKKYNKPVFCSFIGGSLVAQGEAILNDNRIPAFRFPERAIYAISMMWKFKKHLNDLSNTKDDVQDVVKIDTSQVKKIMESAHLANYISLDNISADNLLASAGIKVPDSVYADSYESAISFCKKVGYPVVLKLSAPGLLHKNKLGGVFLHITGDLELRTAWDQMLKNITMLPDEYKNTTVIQVQKEVEKGIEALIGVKRDPTFGDVLLVGAGGSFVELISDRNLHLLPITRSQVKTLFEKTKIYKALTANTSSAYALDKLYDIIIYLSKLFELLPEASDIEINPVIITSNDVWAVDSKVLLSKSNSITGEKNMDTTQNSSQQVKAGPKFKTAVTISHVNEASTFHYFEFKPVEPLVFEPGQYISVKVAADRINCYSLAQKDTNGNFNLFVDVKPGGPGSKYFQNLKVGDEISYLGPFGTFTLKKDDGAKNLLFLGTGSGCSPLRAMIMAALEQYKITTPIYLYIGLNFVDDIFWKKFLDEVSSKYANFNYQIAIWKPDETWSGAVGFITDLVKKDFPDASSCSAYLCGAKPMLDNAIPLLQQLGCPSQRIYTEKY